jgi:hypothetical protein
MPSTMKRVRVKRSIMKLFTAIQLSPMPVNSGLQALRARLNGNIALNTAMVSNGNACSTVLATISSISGTARNHTMSGTASWLVEGRERNKPGRKTLEGPSCRLLAIRWFAVDDLKRRTGGPPEKQLSAFESAQRDHRIEALQVIADLELHAGASIRAFDDPVADVIDTLAADLEPHIRLRHRVLHVVIGPRYHFLEVVTAGLDVDGELTFVAMAFGTALEDDLPRAIHALDPPLGRMPISEFAGAAGDHDILRIRRDASGSGYGGEWESDREQ